MNKIVHFIWVGRPIRPLNKLVMDHNIKELNDLGIEWKIHTDNRDNIPQEWWDNSTLVDLEYMEEMKKHPCVYHAKKDDLRFPHLVDMLRYKIILENGGMYLDTDEFILADPFQILDMTKLNFMQESPRWITNSTIYAPTPGNEVLKEIVDYLFADGWNYNQWAVTGPILITTWIYEKLKDKIEADPDRNVDSQGWPLLQDYVRHGSEEYFNVIPDTVYPLKWGRFHRMVNENIPFDTNMYREQGFKILGLYGSLDTRGSNKIPAEGVPCTFITNQGTIEIMFGAPAE